MGSQRPNSANSGSLQSRCSSPAKLDLSYPSSPAQLVACTRTSNRRQKPSRRNRELQFGGQDAEVGVTGDTDNPRNVPTQSRRGSNFYLHSNLSDASLESSALLDHREQQSMRPRRPSTILGHHGRSNSTYDNPKANDLTLGDESDSADRHEEDASEVDENAPLISRTHYEESGPRASKWELTSPIRPLRLQPPFANAIREYGSINFPPSVPGSPRVVPIVQDTNSHDVSDLEFLTSEPNASDTVIDIEGDGGTGLPYQFVPSSPPMTGKNGGIHAQNPAEEDVCFPIDDGLMDDIIPPPQGIHQSARTRRREWPDFDVLEEWSRQEKEQRSEGVRAKKLRDPVYIGGRLRPSARPQWFKEESDTPYRFTYFNEDLPATIHAHTISELLQPGQSFRELFRPDPSLIEDEEDAGNENQGKEDERENKQIHGQCGAKERIDATTPGGLSLRSNESVQRDGPRPTFWLDVFQPTDAEMKVLSKSFGIHPLTVEDIMMQEAREKVELFRSYYLVSYRTFEHDSNNEDFMEPVNLYAVVFREGILTFHFSMIPHPANVRRRVRQLKDYITVSADWISYALIDDITDAFAPLIRMLEDEVDDIDDTILSMHLGSEVQASSIRAKARSEEDHKSDGEMLKRVGNARRKVMGLYRLMGNKADVIKGFAKRCNEQWEVAPRSEIGLYLGDIQDHIITMVSNLNHMEKILSRSHSNYLAQINIKMNERQEQTADVLGRLTVLGTIVLPMNIITGLWGMNVMVPGQDIANLDWFWCITAGLVIFGSLCYVAAKRVYKIM